MVLPNLSIAPFLSFPPLNLGTTMAPTSERASKISGE